MLSEDFDAVVASADHQASTSPIIATVVQLVRAPLLPA
jgi:hypothetical protein